MSSDAMRYKITDEDLERCFQFAIEYHLSVGGGSYNRTTGQYRGLGGVVDSFFIGKLIEIGVARIIENFTDKKMLLDFEIHGPTDDPDIVAVEESGKRRSPMLFVEIKNTSQDDRWTGLTMEQFNTILNNETISGDPSKAFTVYAYLACGNEEKDSDLLGVYLKTEVDNQSFENFSELSDLEIVIKCVVGLDELKEKGTEFREGSYMYETDIFRPATAFTSKRVLNSENRNIFKTRQLSSDELPIIMRDRMPEPNEFGKFEYEGDLEVFVRENEKSSRMYIYCRSDVTVKNKVLGIFNLEKGKLYECFFETLGRSPVLKRNNIWIAHRNLEKVLGTNMEIRIKEIAENI